MVIDSGPTPNYVQTFSLSQPRPASYRQQPPQLSQVGDNVEDRRSEGEQNLQVANDGISDMYQTYQGILRVPSVPG